MKAYKIDELTEVAEQNALEYLDTMFTIEQLENVRMFDYIEEHGILFDKKGNVINIINAIPQFILDQVYSVEGSTSTLYEILSANNNDKDVTPIIRNDIDRLVHASVNNTVSIGMLQFKRIA